MSAIVRNFGSVVGGVVGQVFGPNGIVFGGTQQQQPSLDPITITPEMSVIVNGQVIRGTNISVVDGAVFVDGKPYVPPTTPTGSAYSQLRIEIKGNIAGTLKTTSGDVSVTGDVGAINTMSGDVDVTGNANGDVRTMSGDVKVGGNVEGSASTMSGDITGCKKRRRE